MLRIGLTGGIGAGKSTVSATFSDLGGIVIDGDVIAREVVEPGTPGLASLVDAFGEAILLPDGALNRPALAAIAFSDEEKRATLNGIVHPLVAHRRSELIDAADEEAVIVEDIPLLVESQMAPMFPLVVIVHADEEVRVKRLIEYRHFTEEDARARIAAQAGEEQRRAVADVWLDNSGSAGELVEKARALWHERIQPFARNLEAGTPAKSEARLVPSDPSWPAQAQRILARLRTACGHRASRIDHIGSTAVPGLDAKDVIDVQVTVASLEVADGLADALLGAGYVRTPVTTDISKPDPRSTVAEFDHEGGDGWLKRLYCSADPGRPTNVHVRVDGRPGQQFALLFVAWLNANPAVRAEYLDVKRRVAAQEHAMTGAYAEAKEPWFLDAYRRAWEWADTTGWRP
ncbi:MULTISPECIES: dephospho-CoA kinase [Mycolicibacterium]|uniref:Dephospho-CoA kinase n=1 Tax=Mycolicibacterium vanbaalenii (strain DSM 7251 / JCM 13017 / BCRC 16820 / KCTC 9966 / NRRL B-24157 / PYR-1) TaxID=350058 RepID=A1TAF0_MYCVP|nr:MULTISPECIES: dephospho-CoA kinase [Mycolicibacterium]ABM14150.1 dephospho-CoA kinase [Mycolicibacterium vanbaalenii PYR-1]MCV7130113.1 dephospho-CoA kinase [Mycolicibacterium vanbaalenii PYR-1]QZY44053.1 dephospho-CoA kinase [Mycolicibacterium austroafricanum]UJL27770.1 dephospho-CoA kinase [Mycolicibacterium vanbaalenii]WND54455.1 dephospho-CoA kinase [Mycolicibacterium vanbaalenii]